MFEQILKELKTKYKNLGLSEEYLKVIAKRLAKTVKEESEIEEAVADLEDEMKFQQSQNDTIRTLKTQVKKFEEGGKQDPPKKEEKKKEDPPKEEEMPAWAKAFKESIETLSGKLENQEKEKINQTNEQKLISKLKELGVNEFFYKSQITGRVFENEEQIIEFANTIKENEDAYKQAVNDTKLKGVEPPKGGIENVKGQVSADVQSFINENFKKDE